MSDICGICGGPYDRLGNNARPFEGRCCDECDDRFVTPARTFNIGYRFTLKLLAAVAKLGRLNVLMRAEMEAQRR